MSDYFEALGDLAARAEHSGTGFDDVLSQAIARAFALCICASPSVTMHVVNLLSESNPSQRLLHLVEKQLGLLQEIGVPTPELILELFRRTCHFSPDPNHVRDRLWLNNEDNRAFLVAQGVRFSSANGDPSDLEGTIDLDVYDSIQNLLGVKNTYILRLWQPFGTLLAWFDQVSEDLLGSPNRVSFQFLGELKKRLEIGGDLDPFSHSRRFWTYILFGKSDERDSPHACVPLEKLVQEIYSPEGAGPNTAVSSPDAPLHLRPDIVLWSDEFAEWGVQARSELRRRKNEYSIYEREITLFDQTLARFTAGMGSLARGAGTQRDIVLGVMNHGLLESLDEQVFIFLEVAQMMDPRGAWSYENLFRTRSGSKADRSHGGVAAAFGEYLIDLARQGLSIPKNLRTVQEVLHAYERMDLRSASQVQRNRYAKIIDLCPEQDVWDISEMDKQKWRIELAELPPLRLAVRELVDNHRLHGKADTRAMVKATDDVHGLSFMLPFSANDDQVHERLYQLKEHQLQRPIERRRDRRVPSHGVGLYLANLVAARAGWRLEISNLEGEWVTFKLWRVHHG